jgi:hypothetical protein
MSDRAMRELLELCRGQGIAVALLLTPEGSAFQSWYSPEARRCVDDYCDALSREYGVPLIDGRDWLDDTAFADSHHVTLGGAAAFTLRLGREVLQPLIDGKLGSKNLKSQIPRKSKGPNPNDRNLHRAGFGFRISVFGFPWDLGFGIWVFLHA